MHTLFSIKNDPVQSIIIRLTANDPTLQVVKCGQLSLDSASSREIFSALKYSTHVKKLEFLGNNSKGAIKFLAESIRAHQSLEEIYLGTNGLDDEEFFYLYDSLKANLSSVQLLDVNTNEGITDVSAHHIAELIEKSTHIKKMEISFTCITDKGLHEILNTLERNPASPLLELCEPDILNFGLLTQNEELAQKLSDLFSTKQNSISMTLI
jgi:Ran GTPase-activating protein (RanGAP) involved in mRNA processing and transport